MKRILLLVLCVAALALHLTYWYMPHERAASPRPQSLAGGVVLSETGAPITLWVPYPHQNLAVLRERLESAGPHLRLLADALDVEIPQMRSFGPLAFPPARALAVSTDQDGESFAAVTELYPSIAWVGRSAGRLAGNPWLAGGTIENDDGPLQVTWEGRNWKVESGSFDPVAGGTPSEAPAPSLAVLRLREVIDPLPRGLYRVLRHGSELRIVSGEEPIGSDLEDSVGALGLPLVLARGDGNGLSVLSLLDSVEGLPRSWPSSTVFQIGDTPRQQLVGESLFRLVGKKLRQRQVGEWELYSSDSKSLGRSIDLLREIAAAVAGSERRLRLFLWLDLEQARRLLGPLAAAVEPLPRVLRREMRTWLAAAALLEVFADYERLSIVITAEPDQVMVRLHAGAG